MQYQLWVVQRKNLFTVVDWIIYAVYIVVYALIDTTADDSNLAEEESIRLLAVFDHEEIEVQVHHGRCFNDEY